MKKEKDSMDYDYKTYDYMTRDKLADLIGAIALLGVMYVFIFWKTINYENVKIIIPIISAVAGYIIHRSIA